MEQLETLGERLRQGDKAVIPEIITILAPAVTATVRRAAKGKYSEDISQDALLHLTGALSRVQLQDNNVALWVLTKTYYLALDYLRRYIRGEMPSTELSQVEYQLVAPYSSESCEAREIVERVLAEFDETAQMVVKLSMEDYTFREIAAKVGLSPMNVCRTYHKFGKRCKQLVGA